jgi:hypothetical protein
VKRIQQRLGTTREQAVNNLIASRCEQMHATTAAPHRDDRGVVTAGAGVAGASGHVTACPHRLSDNNLCKPCPIYRLTPFW